MRAPSLALPRQWNGVWLDALAFGGGLAMAWFADWNTTDLVWSLWLSSFVVGYALIGWSLTATLREFGRNVVRDENRGVAWIGIGIALSFFASGAFRATGPYRPKRRSQAKRYCCARPASGPKWVRPKCAIWAGFQPWSP